MKNYTCILERRFEVEALHNYSMFLEELGRRSWIKLNYLIKESNQTIALKFYVNAYNRGPCQSVSFIRSEEIDYSSFSINGIL